MSMKKTDLVKHLAKKLDGRMKASAAPQRFGKGSAVAKDKREETARPPTVKLVPLSCRLPADLVERLHPHAMGREGGMSSVVTEAVAQWLAAAEAAAPKG